jgi:hypothetical protein
MLSSKGRSLKLMAKIKNVWSLHFTQPVSTQGMVLSHNCTIFLTLGWLRDCPLKTAVKMSSSSSIKLHGVTFQKTFAFIVVIRLQIRKGIYIQSSNITWVFLDGLVQQRKKDAYELLQKRLKLENPRQINSVTSTEQERKNRRINAWKYLCDVGIL